MTDEFMWPFAITRNNSFFSCDTKTTYPPYNFYETPDGEQRLDVAVAGFSIEELAISINEKNELCISGKKRNREDKNHYFHRGISNKNFTLTFIMANPMSIESAEIINGILRITTAKVERKNIKIPIVPQDHLLTEKKEVA